MTGNPKSISQEKRQTHAMTTTTMAMIMVLVDTATDTTCLKEKQRLRLLQVSQVSLPGYLEKNNQVSKKDAFMVSRGEETAEGDTG